MFGSRVTVRSDSLSGEKELVRKICLLELYEAFHSHLTGWI